MWHDILSAVALLLILEGLLPFLSPKNFKQIIAKISTMGAESLRLAGFCYMLAGLLLLYFVR